MSLLGLIILTLGAGFLALGGLGLWRMPDIWCRIQAGTKATTLGTILTMLGAGLIEPAWAGKLGLIALFLMFTNPLSAQVLARAAHRARLGAAPQTIADALADAEAEGRA